MSKTSTKKQVKSQVVELSPMELIGAACAVMAEARNNLGILMDLATRRQWNAKDKSETTLITDDEVKKMIDAGIRLNLQSIISLTPSLCNATKAG